MRLRRLHFWILASCQLTAASSAVHAQAGGLIDGMGNSSCVKFIELNAQNEQVTQLIFGNWAQGFLSGLNVERSITKRKSIYPVPGSAAEAAKQLLARCRSQPNLDVLSVQLDLLAEHDKAKE